MELAIREDYPVQMVPHAVVPRARSLSSDVEQVYDHRPRPLSRRNRKRDAERHQPSPVQANDSDKGIFVAAVVFMMSLVICCSGLDD